MFTTVLIGIRNVLSVVDIFGLSGFALPAQVVLTSGASAKSLNYQVAGTTSNVLLPSSGKKRRGAMWVQAEETTISSIYLKLKRTGSMGSGDTVRVAVFESVGGVPVGETVSVSDDVVASGIGTSAGWIKFSFDEFTLPAGTYHVVLMGNYDASDTHNVSWMSKTVASGGNASYLDSIGGSWTAVETESLMVFAPVHVIFDDTVSDMSLGYVPAQNIETQITCRRSDVSEIVKGDTITMLDGENINVSYRVLKPVPEDADVTTIHLKRSELSA